MIQIVKFTADILSAELFDCIKLIQMLRLLNCMNSQRIYSALKAKSPFKGPIFTEALCR